MTLSAKKQTALCSSSANEAGFCREGHIIMIIGDVWWLWRSVYGYMSQILDAYQNHLPTLPRDQKCSINILVYCPVLKFTTCWSIYVISKSIIQEGNPRNFYYGHSIEIRVKFALLQKISTRDNLLQKKVRQGALYYGFRIHTTG